MKNRYSQRRRGGVIKSTNAIAFCGDASPSCRSTITIQTKRKGKRRRLVQQQMFLIIMLILLQLIPRFNATNDAPNDAPNDANDAIPTSPPPRSIVPPTTSSSSSSSTTASTTAKTATRTHTREKRNKAFLKWSQATLGIHTLLEIKEFEYINHFEEWKFKLMEQNKFLLADEDNDHDHDHDHGNDENKKHHDGNNAHNSEASKVIRLRGLAATRTIEIDEVLISVPYHALITIQTTIDHDPVLSQILGPKARLNYGWIISSTSSSTKTTSTFDVATNNNNNNNNNNNDNDNVVNSATESIISSETFNGHDDHAKENNIIDNEVRTALSNDKNSDITGGNNYDVHAHSQSSSTLNDNNNNNNNNNNNTNEESSKKTSTSRSKNTNNTNNPNTERIIQQPQQPQPQEKDSTYFEIGLLTVAILYHRSLGELSPIWFQIESLLDHSVSGEDNIPLLWNRHRLFEEFNGVTYGPSGDEVRRLVLSMKKDVKMMYDEIMHVLIQNHGDLFGKPHHHPIYDAEIEDVVEDDGQGNDLSREWMFSYEKFEWAFAIVNSRKWHLPLADLDDPVMASAKKNQRDYQEYPTSSDSIHDEATGGATANSIPAQQPTDEYLTQQNEANRLEYSDDNLVPQPAPSPSLEEIKNIGDDNMGVPNFPLPSLSNKNEFNDMSIKHSFMAPLADMLNFGPPCAKGRYNTETKAFEVIATCRFLKGQEVTFWYSDDCENIMIANYGFTDPMIPPCFSADDWEDRSEIWRKYAQSLEKTLDQVYEELYDTLKELEDCNCVGQSNSNTDHQVPTRESFQSVESESVGENGHSGIRRTSKPQPRDPDHDDTDL